MLVCNVYYIIRYIAGVEQFYVSDIYETYRSENYVEYRQHLSCECSLKRYV